MKFFLILSFFLMSGSAFAQSSSDWVYVGPGSEATEDNHYTVATTQADSFSLSLIWWDVAKKWYVVFVYDNPEKLKPIDGSIEFSPWPGETLFSEPSFDALPGAGRSQITTEASLSDLFVLEDMDYEGFDLGVAFTTAETGRVKYVISTYDFNKAFGDMQDAYKALTEIDMFDAQKDMAKRARRAAVENIFETFEVDVLDCGTFKKYSLYDSESELDRTTDQNEIWFDCLEAEYLGNIELFKRLVVDIGGEVKLDKADDSFSFSAPDDLPSLKRVLDKILEIIQNNGVRGVRARADYNDYIRDFNEDMIAYRQDKNARIADQNRQNRNEQFWNNMSESLARGQRDIDAMNAQTQSIFHNPGYTSPGYD